MQTLSGNLASRIGAGSGLGPAAIAMLALFAANVGMLVIYFALDLTLFQLVVVYWWEALWIGLYSGLKLLTASVIGDPFENRWVEVSKGSGFFISLFAIVKSGGAFLTIVALTGVALVVAQEGLTGTPGNDFVRDQVELLLVCSLVFLIGHGLSFVINFLLLGEFRTARIGPLMLLPFKRAFGLFVTIVAALTASQAWPGLLDATGFAVALIGIKLAWDYLLHVRERCALGSRPA